MYAVTQSCSGSSPSSGASLFLVSAAWFEAFGQRLGSTLFPREKRQSFSHASRDHGNFECQEFTPVSGNFARSHLKCWRLKREGSKHRSGAGGRRGPCTFSASCSIAQNIRNAFGSAYNCTLCQNYKARCGTAKRTLRKIWPYEAQSTPNKKEACVEGHGTSPVRFSLFLKARTTQPRMCLFSGEG